MGCGFASAGEPETAPAVNPQDYARAARVEGRVASSSRSDLSGEEAVHSLWLHVSVVWNDPIRVIHPPRYWDLETLRVNDQALPNIETSTHTPAVQALGWQTYRDTYLRLHGQSRRGIDGTFSIERFELKTLPRIIDRLTATGEFAFARPAEPVTVQWDPNQPTAAINDDWNLTLLTSESDAKIGPGIVNVRLERRRPRDTGAFPDPMRMNDVPVGVTVFDADGALIHAFDELRWSDFEAMKSPPGKETYRAQPLIEDHPLPAIHQARVDFIPGLERRSVTVDIENIKPPHTGEKPNRLAATVFVGPALETPPPTRQPLRRTASEWHPYSRPDEETKPDLPGRLSLNGLYDPTLTDGWWLLPETFAVTHLAEEGTDLLKPTDVSGRRYPPLPELPDPGELADALWSLHIGQAIQQQQRNPNLTNLSRWSASATLIHPPVQESFELGSTAMALRNGEVTTTFVPIPAVGESQSLSPELSLWRRPDNPDAQRTGCQR